MLFGSIANIAGFSVASLNSVVPQELDHLQDYVKRFQSMYRHYSHDADSKNFPPEFEPFLKGFYLIGIYCPEERLLRLSHSQGLFKRSLSTYFARYLGENYLIVTSRLASPQKKPSLSFWSRNKRKVTEVPNVQVVLKQAIE